MDKASFLYVCCQPGAESVLKRELSEAHPSWRFAFSRPGFVTFKWTAESPPSERLQLKSVFARCYGWSLGPIVGDDDEARADHVMAHLPDTTIKQLHVWRRQAGGAASGLPLIVSDETNQLAECVRKRLVQADKLSADVACNRPAVNGESVCDCIMVAPGQWWLGWHRAVAFSQHWPGGVPLIDEPANMVSRAYLKMREAMMWSRFPLGRGDTCIDLGSAPGGTSQALLEAGLKVMGIDPAEMNSTVMKNPDFMHVRKRGADVRRRDFRGYKWLVADANLVPSSTLDMVESIVTHESTSVQGVLLNLKFLDWKRTGELAEYTRRVRSWGYDDVRCRQLACNRQEVCLAALRSQGIRRRRLGPGPS